MKCSHNQLPHILANLGFSGTLSDAHFWNTYHGGLFKRGIARPVGRAPAPPARKPLITAWNVGS